MRVKKKRVERERKIVEKMCAYRKSDRERVRVEKERVDKE